MLVRFLERYAIKALFLGDDDIDVAFLTAQNMKIIEGCSWKSLKFIFFQTAPF